MIGSVPRTVIVVDTGVLSRVMARRQNSQELRDELIGRIPVVATQTRAELLAWPRLRNWGSDRGRLAAWAHPVIAAADGQIALVCAVSTSPWARIPTSSRTAPRHSSRRRVILSDVRRPNPVD